MKKYYIIVVLTAITIIICACGVLGLEDRTIEISPSTFIKIEEEPVINSEKEPESDVKVLEQAEIAQTGSYTIEQIQQVLENSGAFNVGDFGEGNPIVISAEQVERDRDSINHEASGQVFDLTNSIRYKVELKFRQSLEEFNLWYEIYKGADFNPFKRDGDYTILTEHYYFHDVDGEPKLAFLKC